LILISGIFLVKKVEDSCTAAEISTVSRRDRYVEIDLPPLGFLIEWTIIVKIRILENLESG